MPPDLHRSPLLACHRAAGAVLTAFGGWEMPLHYGSVLAEHRAVRESVGVFDLSHLGTLRVHGQEAAACLRRALTNDVEGLPVGRGQYSLCLDEEGGIVDDLLVYHLPEGFLVVPNAANTGVVQGLLQASSAGLDAAVADVKEALACIAVQGPASPQVLADVGLDVSDMAYLDVRPRGEQGLLARSGYTGERGYELFVASEDAPALWDGLVAAGASPAGLGARDTLRLEMGYPLHGNDISPTTSPVEARLTWAVKGAGFRGEAAFRAAREAGPQRRLWGLRVAGRGIPRAGCVVHRGGEEVGRTTSGTFSPTLRIGVALGYVSIEVERGETVDIDVRGKTLPAEVVRPPFVDADPKR